MERRLSEDEWAEALRSFDRSARRLEVQPTYLVGHEAPVFERFLAGEPAVPTESDGFRDWLDQVAKLTASGRRVERVRVHDEPPSPYQRFERWAGEWNTAAGESIRYMTRARAYEIGLLPAAADRDWWLMDSSWLVTMRYDKDGRRVENVLVTDPRRVAQACEWWDLADHHSTSDTDV